MKLTEHFELSEFKCKDGTEVPEKYTANVQELADNLEKLRVFLGESIHITSGFRTSAYNKKVGGKPASKHLKAQAADIIVGSLTPKQLYRIIEGLINIGVMKQGGLGLYSTFVHYDVRGTKARW